LNRFEATSQTSIQINNASWTYFIWGFDWGASYRSHGLWAMVFFLGAMVAFLAGLYGIGIAGSYIFPDEFSDKS